LDGSAVAITVKAAEAKLVSTGAAMPIDVAKLFSETESEVELWLSTAGIPRDLKDVLYGFAHLGVNLLAQ
jgi:hypothetical protein